MHFLPLLGKRLKDDEVLELLEDHDIEVVYDFDRLHENTPDKYWAASKKDGFQFGFSEAQVLDVVFLYAAPVEGFSAIDRADLDVPVFAGVTEVEAHCAAKNLGFKKGQVRGGVLADRDWARIDAGEYSIHYDFRAGVLTIITASLPRKK